MTASTLRPTEQPEGTTASPTPSPIASTATGPTAGFLWRRARVPLALLALALLVATVIAAVSASRNRAALDPRSVSPEGSRALSVLLGQRGVAVVRLVNPAAAARRAGPGSVLLVARAEGLTREQLDALATTSPEATVVLVAPSDPALDRLTEGVTPDRPAQVEVREPRCGLPAAAIAGDAHLGGRTFEVTGATRSCYPAGGSPTLVVTRQPDGPRMIILGTGAPLTNERLGERGNAALALGLLAGSDQTREVLWLLPRPGATDSEQTPLSRLLPDTVLPALWQLGIAALLLALWRCRRLGPPVVEPLPVVVRAAETVEGRARLYRRSRARDRAAEHLRAGVRARLAPPLGLGLAPAPGALVDAVAARCGRSTEEVTGLLFGPAPASDAALVQLADALDRLTRDTLQPVVPDREAARP